MKPELKIKKLDFNKPQLNFIALQPKEATLIWGRATGKSSLIAWLIHLIVQYMPRSAWILQGATYTQILTRTLPSTVASLERIGYIRDVHYFVGRKAPASWNWPLPYEQPLKFDHFIHFYTGAGFHMVSQDAGGGSSRGLNVDGIITDESLLLDKEQFDSEASATNRGNLRYFSKVPFHHGIFHFSSMPYGDQGKWLLKNSEYYEENSYDFTFLRNELIKQQLKFIDTKDIQERLLIYSQIRKINQEISFYKSKAGLLYSEANCLDNLQNVGIKYIEQQRRELTEFIFLIEMLNKRNDKIEGGFYPTLEAKHEYSPGNSAYLTSLDYNTALLANELDSRFDADCIPTLPLQIAVDWGNRINCMSLGQESLEGFNFINSLFVLQPQILDDLAAKFCKYYRYHSCRDIYFYYDHTGNTHMANSNLTYSEQFAKILKENGWNVFFLTEGAAPSHQEKYLLWHRTLKEDLPRYPKVRFNKEKCKYLLISMNNAPAKEGKNGIEKHKGSERSSSIAQNEATHLSDTADILLSSKYKHLLEEQTSFSPVIYGS